MAHRLEGAKQLHTIDYIATRVSSAVPLRTVAVSLRLHCSGWTGSAPRPTHHSLDFARRCLLEELCRELALVLDGEVCHAGLGLVTSIGQGGVQRAGQEQ